MLRPRPRRSQGMNWVRQSTRLAIYLRDGMACVYCGARPEDARMTLDHLVPYSRGGANAPENLVMCCVGCNSLRGARPLSAWARAVGTTAARVRAVAARPLPRAEARDLLARRGTVAAVLRGDLTRRRARVY